MALRRDWTLEKHVSIDWRSADEILGHHFTLHGMLDSHPRLRAHLEALGPIGPVSRTFLDQSTESKAEQRRMLSDWIRQGLFDLRSDRWCHRCGAQGHTKTACFNEAPKSNAVNPLQRHQQRQTEMAVRQLDAKVVASTEQQQPAAQVNRAANLNSRANVEMRKQVQTAGFVSRPTVVDELQYKGIVKALHRDSGELLVPGVGTVAFYFDRLLYGLKKVKDHDEVRCRIERTGERTLAVDVRPVNPALTRDDVRGFIADCDAGGANPISQMRLILEQRHVWPQFLQCLQDWDAAQRHLATNVIVRMVTFLPNREPINASLLRAFIELLCSGTEVDNFFPRAVLETLPQSPEAAAQHVATTPMAADMLMELTDFLIMVRTYADGSSNDVRPVVDAMSHLINACAAAPTPKGKLNYILARRERLSAAEISMELLPTAEQLTYPAAMPQSAFHPTQLPVNVTRRYKSAEELIRAQCELLRADTFTSFSNVLAAACFQLPHYTPDAQVLEDVKYTRAFDGVTYMGRVCSKDRDQVKGYVFKVRAKGEVNWRHSLAQGSFVCFTTGLDRTVVDPAEIFFGVVGLHDLDLIAQGITIIHPCEGSNFGLLLTKLQRNVACDKLECSMVLEATGVFLHGYAPVMRALTAFLGISASTLPMSDIIVNEKKPPTTGNISMIPPHFTDAHARILSDITRPLILDGGQAATMSSLRHAPMVLVQGPPGTGKSFIGCRVVESIVRYKRAVANGDALRYVDVSKLPDCKPDTLTPQHGPVVVITYKNHALDEFLVDLLHSGLWCGAARSKGGCYCTGDFSGCCPKCCKHPASIVRVGGRSQAPELLPYNLGELMASKAAHKDVAQGRVRCAVLLRKIERLASEIRNLERGELIQSAYEELLTLEHKSTLRFTDIDSWLAGDKYIGKDTAILAHYSTQLHCTIDDALAYESKKQEGDDIDPHTAHLDMDDGLQLSVMAAMKADAPPQERDAKQLRASMISAEAAALGTDLRAKKQTLVPPVEGLDKMQSLWSLSPQKRHETFVFYVQMAIATRAADYLETVERMETAAVLLDHARERARQEMLKSVDVIGLTTTGCAMHQNLLRSLKPSVLVVEEAAEILESQLLACFTDSLVQVVLIGDHYQLQPKVETMALEKHNNMNVSLFERLVKHISPEVLSEQRRMRSGIADLVRPFYNKDPLRDHESVKNRPYVDKYGHHHTVAVPGLPQEVFFWTHEHPEESSKVGRSKINTMEADMVTSLVRHLLQQGVRPPSITVITPYLGQRRYLLGLIKAISRDVRVSTVDRFQGDEADVIILSLVRTQQLTEFIRMRNRMIVACSRARFAMVMVGSESLLLKSPHWKRVIDHLKTKSAIGPELPVCDTASGATAHVRPEQRFSDWFGATTVAASAD